MYLFLGVGEVILFTNGSENHKMIYRSHRNQLLQNQFNKTRKLKTACSLASKYMGDAYLSDLFRMESHVLSSAK